MTSPLTPPPKIKPIVLLDPERSFFFGVKSRTWLGFFSACLYIWDPSKRLVRDENACLSFRVEQNANASSDTTTPKITTCWQRLFFPIPGVVEEDINEGRYDLQQVIEENTIFLSLYNTLTKPQSSSRTIETVKEAREHLSKQLGISLKLIQRTQSSNNKPTDRKLIARMLIQAQQKVEQIQHPATEENPVTPCYFLSEERQQLMLQHTETNAKLSVAFLELAKDDSTPIAQLIEIAKQLDEGSKTLQNLTWKASIFPKTLERCIQKFRKKRTDFNQLTPDQKQQEITTQCQKVKDHIIEMHQRLQNTYNPTNQTETQMWTFRGTNLPTGMSEQSIANASAAYTALHHTYQEITNLKTDSLEKEKLEMLIKLDTQYKANYQTFIQAFPSQKPPSPPRPTMLSAQALNSLRVSQQAQNTLNNLPTQIQTQANQTGVLAKQQLLAQIQGGKANLRQPLRHVDPDAKKAKQPKPTGNAVGLLSLLQENPIFNRLRDLNKELTPSESDGGFED